MTECACVECVCVWRGGQMNKAYRLHRKVPLFELHLSACVHVQLFHVNVIRNQKPAELDCVLVVTVYTFSLSNFNVRFLLYHLKTTL